MLKVENKELTERLEENHVGMVSFEHLRQVIDRLSILLIRTDRGIYKKTKDRVNVTQSIIMQSL